MFNNYYNGKKVLITGHTGFKGTWLAIWLNILEAKVYGYSLNPISKPNNYTICNIKKITKDKIEDIRNEKCLTDFIRKVKPEIVFHLAAQPIVRESYKKPKETYEVNIIGLVNLFNAIRTVKSVKKVIVITSDKCYENIETQEGYKENDILGGSDPYSSSKACAEIVTSSFYRSFLKEKGITAVTARAGNVIGGGDWSKYRLIPDCVRSITNNKNITLRNPYSTRPWQHVLEPLSGYLWMGAITGNGKTSENLSLNFGPENSSDERVLKVVRMFIIYWGINTKLKTERQNDKLHESKLLHLSIEKAKIELKWKPNWGIEKTIEETAKWYKYYYKNRCSMHEYSRKQIMEYCNDAQIKRIEWSF